MLKLLLKVLKVIYRLNHLSFKQKEQYFALHYVLDQTVDKYVGLRLTRIAMKT